MQPDNKILTTKFFSYLLAGSILLFATIYWFSGTLKENLNADEPLWIALTEFYQYRTEHNWDRFQLEQSDMRSGYGRQVNMLFDQPQTGKYFMGVTLQILRKNPWQHEDLSWVYQDFSSIKIPGDGSPNQLNSYLQTPLAQAINIIRIENAFLGLLVIILFSGIVFQFLKSYAAAISTLLLLTSDLVLRNYFRKAMTDSISSLTLLLAGIFIWFGVEKFYRQQKISLVLFFLSGCTSAIASSIKMNGFFLLGLPFWLLFSYSLFYKKQKQLNKKLLIGCVFLFLIGFAISFYLLEPEVWNHPLAALTHLFHTRISQQERFYLAFGKVNYLLMPTYLLATFLKSIPFLFLIPTFFTFTLGVSVTLRELINKNKKTYYVLGLLCYIFLTNSYYARTGFDRYLIPSFFCLFFMNAIGIQKAIQLLKLYVQKH